MQSSFPVRKPNGIVLSYRKEHIWVSYNEVDEPRAYYTEWSKMERERQILHINTYMWNLVGWYWWSYIQGSKECTDIKNRVLDSVGEREGGMIWENSTETCALPYVEWMASESSMHEAGHPGLVLCDNLRDRVERKVGGEFRLAGGICIPMANSCWSMAKVITIL